MRTAEIWRALFRHPKLEDSLGDVAELLGRELGVRLVLVREVDLTTRAMSTRALHQLPREWLAFNPAPCPCQPDEVAALLTWQREGAPRRGNPTADPLLSRVLGTSKDLDGVMAPLGEVGSDSLGVLVLAGDPGSFDQRHEQEAGSLLAPFGAALAAARRLQELERLREGVVADNQALLSKLGREDVVGSIIGADAGFSEVMTRVQQVAPTDAPVLLLGETGTGKEVVARVIHTGSRRAPGPMLRVNCGAIPAGLVDSELFGHERGSFTGAVQGRAGWFERANGGTLFLDEIGELPPAAQVRLLRVLQEGILERVGGQHTIPVDVRIVAATHRDLSAMVRDGAFRQDLWYRVSVFPIALPPLRERRQDIPPMAAHFAWHAGKRLGGQPLVPTSEDLDLLVRYDWPGNVRELAAVIERAIILGSGKRLDVTAALGGERPPTGGPLSRSPGGNGGNGASRGFLTLDAVIAQHIEAALRRAGGKVEGPQGAASLLGVHPQTLRSRMRKLGVLWQSFRGRPPE